MRKVLDFLERQSPSTVLGLSFLLVSIIGWIDSLSGREISLSVFYLIPFVLSASFVDFWPDGDVAGKRDCIFDR
jgi:hypothetical protein